MEFKELAGQRYSCRNFTGEAVDKQKLIDCVETAVLAPSGCNSQPWHFIVVTEPEKRAALAKCTQLLPPSNAFTDRAGAMVVVTEDIEPHVMRGVIKLYGADVYAEGDVGRAMGYFCLRAHELGLGACIIGLFDEQVVADTVGLPENQRIRLLIAVGVPADSDAEHAKKMRPMEEVLSFIE